MKSELRYSTFKNAKATNEGESADFTYLTLKLIAMATSFERIEKEGQIGNKMSIIWWKLVKIGPVDPEFSLPNSLF